MAITRLNPASITVLKVSVVIPLRLETSSENTFVRIPGALFSLSNQESYLKTTPLSSSFLISKVSFSPIIPKRIFSIPQITPIPKHTRNQ